MRHPVAAEFVYQGSSQRAKELGFTYYDNGTPCPTPHKEANYRWVKTYQCVGCSMDRSIERGRRYRKRHPIRARLSTVRSRVDGTGIPLDEAAYRRAWEARPTHCPVFGFELYEGSEVNLANSPEMDRVVPELGYTEGNMRVISRHANRLKDDGSADEHRAIADWMDKERAK